MKSSWRGKGAGPLQVQTPAQQGEKGENFYMSWEQSMSLAPIASIDSKERAIVQHTYGRRAIQYTIKTNEKKNYSPSRSKVFWRAGSTFLYSYNFKENKVF